MKNLIPLTSYVLEQEDKIDFFSPKEDLVKLRQRNSKI